MNILRELTESLRWASTVLFESPTQSNTGREQTFETSDDSVVNSYGIEVSGKRGNSFHGSDRTPAERVEDFIRLSR